MYIFLVFFFIVANASIISVDFYSIVDHKLTLHCVDVAVIKYENILCHLNEQLIDGFVGEFIPHSIAPAIKHTYTSDGISTIIAYE